MLDFVKSLLSENSPISTARFMSVISLFVGSGLGIYGMYHCKDLGGVAQLCAVFIGAAFVGKVGQKFIETKKDGD